MKTLVDLLLTHDQRDTLVDLVDQAIEETLEDCVWYERDGLVSRIKELQGLLAELKSAK
jgi:hypothetical protein